MPKRLVSVEERALDEKARQYLPGGSLGNTPINVIIREGHGSRVWDVSGNELVDYLMGSGPMLVGHGHPDVLAAIREQVEKGTTFFTNNEHAILLAEELVNAVACADKVRFVSSGSEATHYAMRTARAYRNRDKILKFEGGFHGMNDYALMSMSPADPPDYPQAAPDSAGIPSSIRDEMLIAPFNDIETASAIIEQHHEELGGVIVEPFQRIIPPVPGFLEGLREVTRHYEIPLIFDEVVTGFRLAYGGAQEYYGVTPDICTLGKTIAGGFPLAAVAGTEEMMSHFDPVSRETGGYMPQIGTLSGNPVAASAGLATLEVLRREGTYERLFEVGRQLKDGFQRLLTEAEVPAQIVGEPPLFDVVFVDSEITDYRSLLANDKQKAMRFNEMLLERGILKGDWKFYLSTVHTQEDLDLTFQAFASALDELMG
ncbi:MAG: aspartate aminotransferase family protein [Chloroflexi bacterium]|nr:aspartate aminotransferase family protein [Chloroflexota bacterium]